MTQELNETHALAKLTENYDFDLTKKEHKEIMRSLVKLAEKRIENEPVLKKSEQNHSKVISLIVVLGVIVTVSLGIWVNHLNHLDSIQLKRAQIAPQLMFKESK